MPLREIRGQPQALAQLRRALSSQRVHHAYLFAGPAGVGKSEGALLFAQALLCRADSEGCGSCASCDRIARSIHPDVLRLARDAASGGREIKVESLRELCSALQLRSVEGHRQCVALLFEADALTISAQNALLKTLEEPPPNTTLILIASRELKLLPTIRSRCLRIRFGPLPEDLLAEQLQQQKKLTPEEARLIARLAGGSRSQAEGIGTKRLRERSLAIEKWAELMRARGRSAGISAAFGSWPRVLATIASMRYRLSVGFALHFAGLALATMRSSQLPLVQSRSARIADRTVRLIDAHRNFTSPRDAA